MSVPDEKSTSRLWATALRETLFVSYRFADLRADLLAGVTVGVVAVPLAMALAIASGVAPQYGLYTSIVAGIVIALTGGARYSISGPTAAFVVILLPITHQYGLGGLLLTTIMSGLMLLALGLGRLGRLIEYIPYPVTTGFTAGIAVVIAVLQLKDLLGLQAGVMPEHFTDKVLAIVAALPTTRWQDVAVGGVTLAVLILWQKLKPRIPGHLVAILCGALCAWLGTRWIPGFEVATIASRFSYSVGGVTGSGIPGIAPIWLWPWQMPDATGAPIGLSYDLIRTLLPAAFTVALLGAIESLLCAVVADGMTGGKHNPNAELVGQGIGNIVAPFFGGITATGAIARTATNIRAGAVSPLAAVIHGVVVLLAVISFANVLGYLPMASLAALLIMVAWNMSEARHFVNIVRVAPRSDVLVLLACFGLTVMIDMVVAVAVGVGLASLLFIRRMVELTHTTLLNGEHHAHLQNLPEQIAVYDINGPLFFGAAEKAMSVLQRVNTKVRVVIIDMTDVPVLDMTGIVALDSSVKKLNKVHIAVIMAGLNAPIYRKLLRAGMRREPGHLDFFAGIPEAREAALSLLNAQQ